MDILRKQDAKGLGLPVPYCIHQSVRRHKAEPCFLKHFRTYDQLQSNTVNYNQRRSHTKNGDLAADIAINESVRKQQQRSKEEHTTYC